MIHLYTFNQYVESWFLIQSFFDKLDLHSDKEWRSNIKLTFPKSPFFSLFCFNYFHFNNISYKNLFIKFLLVQEGKYSFILTPKSRGNYRSGRFIHIKTITETLMRTLIIWTFIFSKNTRLFRSKLYVHCQIYRRFP